MSRISNWEQELASFIADCFDKPFQWGSHDCALFAADVAHACTGIDRAEDFRGRYETHEGALEVLREVGSGTLLKTFQDRFEEKPKSFAKRGDLIWNGRSMGACMGEFALFVGEEGEREGLVRVERKEWKRAFDV